MCQSLGLFGESMVESGESVGNREIVMDTNGARDHGGFAGAKGLEGTEQKGEDRTVGECREDGVLEGKGSGVVTQTEGSGR